MAAPKFFAAHLTNRGTRIARGPVAEQKMNGMGPLVPPTHGRK
jgi:hypothetical protein